MFTRQRISQVLRAALASFAVTLVAGCGGPTAYAPAGKNGLGYSSQAVEQNRFLVSFRGNSQTDRETVETYLLYRAAELARDRGGTWFRISNQDTETITRFSGSSSGFSGSPFGTAGYSGFSTVSTDFVSVRPIRSFEGFANVQIFKGRKPASDPNAYSVRSVLQTLGPRIRRPEAGDT